MTHIGIFVNDLDYKSFKSAVGKGNITKVLTSYIKSYSNAKDNLDVSVLQQKFELINEQKEKIVNEWQQLKDKLASISESKKVDELKRLEEEKNMEEEESKALDAASDAKYASMKNRLWRVAGAGKK